MRLKTFNAATMNEAMAMVREKLGPDAIIVTSDEGPAGISVTVAYEGKLPVMGVVPEAIPMEHADPLEYEEPLQVNDIGVHQSREYDTAEVTAVLTYHGIPYETGQRINDAIKNVNAPSLPAAFANALEMIINFEPLTDLTNRPIMMVGPPGAGKTVSAAKLTADAVLNDRSVQLISTDTDKAGGVEQLDHFAQLMKQTVATAGSPDELAAILKGKKASSPQALTIIDTQGVNPFDMEDLELILSYIKASNAEPVLVLPAGIDPVDAEDIAEVFSKLGAHRFIATRLDTARRYASIITAARPGKLALAATSSSPYVAKGLDTATPLGLARILTNLPRSKSRNSIGKGDGA